MNPDENPQQPPVADSAPQPPAPEAKPDHIKHPVTGEIIPLDKQGDPIRCL